MKTGTNPKNPNWLEACQLVRDAQTHPSQPQNAGKGLTFVTWDDKTQEYAVCDNGEEVTTADNSEAIRLLTENLDAVDAA